jgi:hypothetical protein
VWQLVGGALDVYEDIRDDDPSLPSLALNSSGNPVVSWYEDDGTSTNIYVKRWDGSGWVQLGTFLDANTNQQDAYDPSLALDSSGNPVVSWKESGRKNIYVKRFVPNTWLDYRNTVDNIITQSAVNSDVSRKSNDNPVIAWTETDTTTNSKNVYVKEWTGSSWKKLGTALDRTLSNNAENPSIDLPSDYPVVAFQENNDIHVKHWNGTIWNDVGSALDNVPTNTAITPSLVVDSASLPVVAFAENGNIFIKKANGLLTTSVWSSVYGAAALDTVVSRAAYRPSLGLTGDNRPIVAWYEDDGTSTNVYVKEWNGTAWVALGGAIDKTLSNNAKDVVLSIQKNNRPIVAWEENNNIYVKRWNGSSWVVVGGTIDKVASNVAARPVIDLKSDNNPVVSWQEQNGASWDVYVKGWNGSSWVDAAPSAFDKVLSKNAQRPSLVLTSLNTAIVSWDEFAGTTHFENVYVRQY